MMIAGVAGMRKEPSPASLAEANEMLRKAGADRLDALVKAAKN